MKNDYYETLIILYAFEARLYCEQLNVDEICDLFETENRISTTISKCQRKRN